MNFRSQNDALQLASHVQSFDHADPITDHDKKQEMQVE